MKLTVAGVIFFYIEFYHSFFPKTVNLLLHFIEYMLNLLWFININFVSHDSINFATINFHACRHMSVRNY